MNPKGSIVSGKVSSKSDLLSQRIRKDSPKKTLKKIQAEFINSVSHQFRTPLATLQSSIDLLEYYFDIENRRRRDDTLVKMKKTIHYLIESLDNITILYKYSIPKQQLLLRKINLRKYLDNLLQEVVIGISDTHYLSININPGIDSIICDEFVLNQILVNLISNAIKYSPNGGQIRLDIVRQNKFVEFTLKDEGIGIDKNDLKKIFMPFCRGKNTTSIPGIGMGLAIVKSMVELLNGRIACVSTKDKGSEFIIRLPQKDIDEKNISN
jgi:signal transduction histidine kinase